MFSECFNAIMIALYAVDEVYVLPNTGYYFEQNCILDIAPESMPGYECSRANDGHLYIYSKTQRHSVSFNVLGARPISLNLDVIWSNHYPVDTNLSWTHAMALDSTTLHVR